MSKEKARCREEVAAGFNSIAVREEMHRSLMSTSIREEKMADPPKNIPTALNAAMHKIAFQTCRQTNMLAGVGPVEATSERGFRDGKITRLKRS